MMLVGNLGQGARIAVLTRVPIRDPAQTLERTPGCRLGHARQAQIDPIGKYDAQ